MRGAIIFLLVFFLFFAITLANNDIPPGKNIYSLLEERETDYAIVGIPATSLVISVFNGVVYGLIAYFLFYAIFTLKKGKNEEDIRHSARVPEGEVERKKLRIIFLK